MPGKHVGFVHKALGFAGEVGVLRILRRDPQRLLLATAGDGFGATIAPST
jgi:hypothetical protein